MGKAKRKGSGNALGVLAVLVIGLILLVILSGKGSDALKKVAPASVTTDLLKSKEAAKAAVKKLEKANDAVTEEDRQELDDLIQKVGK